MKKFIFGLMLLVSMLGIVGCSMDSSDSGGSEDVTYIVKNSTGSVLKISYKTKFNSWTDEQDVPVNGTYKIPASDVGIETIKILGYDVPGNYLSIEGPTKEVCGIMEESLKKGVQIEYYKGATAYRITSIEN